MECECNKSHFWMGLGLGTLLGVVTCQAVRSQKARELKGKICHTLHEMQHKVDGLMEVAKQKEQQ